MHRALQRVIRGTCRKWRENEVPSVAGEEVRNQQDKNEKNFFSQRTSFNEALCWSSIAVISLDLVNRHRNFCSSYVRRSESANEQKRCPFRIQALLAHIWAPYSTVRSINASQTKAIRFTHGKSIDVSPFLAEESLLSSGSETSTTSTISDDDGFAWDRDEGVHSDDNVTIEKPDDPALARFAGDVLSSVGVAKLLLAKRSTNKEPPVSAMELLNWGVELGSARAYYNMGLQYFLKDDKKLAKEYYQRASDLGHPLASYNYAVMALQEGKTMTAEIDSLIHFAADSGVAEAKEFFELRN